MLVNGISYTQNDSCWSTHDTAPNTAAFSRSPSKSLRNNFLNHTALLPRHTIIIWILPLLQSNGVCYLNLDSPAKYWSIIMSVMLYSSGYGENDHGNMRYAIWHHEVSNGCPSLSLCRLSSLGHRPAGFSAILNQCSKIRTSSLI
ncbi:hypothetical protein CDAR_249061 [Caerostris darwini]|uniref:Uncharacterized protein n=1 Tax=Caerostris darwini TaxID=1538125 RepID=A0AAV4R7L0_9ARAC|nr:hypothetical protein CDAR_249061 [Caerostris darwini]